MSAVGSATEYYHVVYGGHRIDFMVVRRRRKTLEIVVEPDASVVVAAPADASIEAIAEKVRKRAAWVRRQQRYFSQFMPRTLERRYLAGETHLYLGRQYRLKVARNGRPRVEMPRGFITAYTRAPVDTIDYVIVHELCPYGGAASWGGVLPVARPGHAGLGGAEGAVGGADGAVSPSSSCR